MPVFQSRSSSPWRRSRYWTTAACVLALMAGLLMLLAGHPLHGGLMLLAGVMLVRGTVFGRRRRRPLHGPGATAAHADSRKWRKAA